MSFSVFEEWGKKSKKLNVYKLEHFVLSLILTPSLSFFVVVCLLWLEEEAQPLHLSKYQTELELKGTVRSYISHTKQQTNLTNSTFREQSNQHHFAHAYALCEHIHVWRSWTSPFIEQVFRALYKINNSHDLRDTMPADPTHLYKMLDWLTRARY